MGRTLDLGRRVELVSMDTHCHDIAIALYQQAGEYLVHSYSSRPGVGERVEFVTAAIGVLGGVEVKAGRLRLGCGAAHLAAIRRAFLEACKLPTNTKAEPRPLAVLDKKTSSAVTVASLGQGRYQVSGERADAIAGGLKKLGEMEMEASAVWFACGQAHDALVGLLLPRALNVRAVLREEEAAASRGMLVAPSAQAQQ